MTPSAVIDTHGVIWYLNADPRLSNRAKNFVDEAGRQRRPVLISAIPLVEIVYPQEKGKIPSGTLTRLEDATRTTDSVLRITELTTGVALAVRQIPRAEVPDMPDRIIAGTALHFGIPVISRDGKIKASIVDTIW